MQVPVPFGAQVRTLSVPKNLLFCFWKLFCENKLTTPVTAGDKLVVLLFSTYRIGRYTEVTDKYIFVCSLHLYSSFKSLINA